MSDRGQVILDVRDLRVKAGERLILDGLSLEVRAGERALAGSVRTHDRVHFAGVDGEIDALEDLAILDADFQIRDLQHVLTDRSFQ